MKVSDCSIKLRKDMDDVTELNKIVVSYILTAPMFFWEQINMVSRGVERDSLSMVEAIDRSLGRSHPKVHSSTLEILSKKVLNYKNLAESGIAPRALTEIFDSIMANVPMGLELNGSIETTYEDLREMYKIHRYSNQIEWRETIKWIENLPVSHLITG